MSANTEPAVTVGTITGIAAAVIALVVAFWPGLLTDVQSEAILSFVAIAAPVVAGIIIRGKVSPVGVEGGKNV